MSLENFPYCFKNPQLLQEALTHRSAAERHNERLEYLGDAVLDFVVAAELYRRIPDADEGELSRLRASLVRRETLAEIALELGLGDAMILGPGELKSGGQRRKSTNANALEALLGAVYLDGGFDACESVILTMFKGRMSERPTMDQLKDPKTRLQEHLQSKHLPLPVYRMADASGAAHQRVFSVACEVPGLDSPVNADGNSRRKAEQAAAKAALAQLGVKI